MARRFMSLMEKESNGNGKEVSRRKEEFVDIYCVSLMEKKSGS